MGRIKKEYWEFNNGWIRVLVTAISIAIIWIKCA